MVAGTWAYPFFEPDEARHAGIVHDMWAARQYLIPRIDAFPTLEGAPLHPWISVALLALFGAQEWVLRLPSALAAGLLLIFICRVFFPAQASRRSMVPAVTALFLLQPALQLAGRFASPDMLNLLLLTVALGCFMQASLRVEQSQWSMAWIAGAWLSTALLGLGAGPLAVILPLLTVTVWLAMRRRLDIMASLCWWPGVPIVVLLLLPWLLLAQARYPGIIAAILEGQAMAVIGGRGLPEYGLGWLLLLAGGLPLAACLWRYRDPRRRARLDTPAARLMAAWLVVLTPLHPLMVSTVAGHTLVLVVPLLYFGALAMASEDGASAGGSVLPWSGFLFLAGAVGVAGAYFFIQRVNTILPVAQAISQRYNASTDKAIMLDRFDHAFNFYMHSSKLVYVASDWSADEDLLPRWKRELATVAPFVPEIASRLLLATGQQADPPRYDELLERLCERRVVNLWIIASAQAPERHPILSDLTSFGGEGKVRAWYLAAGREPAQCVEWALQR